MKKWSKTHFQDIFEEIEEQDNENYDPNVTTSAQRSYIDEINKIETLAELVKYYNEHEWLWKEFAAECTRRKQEIKAKQQDWDTPPA